MLIELGIPEIAYITDVDVASFVERLPPREHPRKGTVQQAWYHMGGYWQKGWITILSPSPGISSVDYRILRVEDGLDHLVGGERRLRRALNCVRRDIYVKGDNGWGKDGGR